MRHLMYYTWLSAFVDSCMDGLVADDRALRRAWRSGQDPRTLAAEVLQAHELQGAVTFSIPSSTAVQDVLAVATGERRSGERRIGPRRTGEIAEIKVTAGKVAEVEAAIGVIAEALEDPQVVAEIESGIGLVETARVGS